MASWSSGRMSDSGLEKSSRKEATGKERVDIMIPVGSQADRHSWTGAHVPATDLSRSSLSFVRPREPHVMRHLHTPTPSIASLESEEEEEEEEEEKDEVIIIGEVEFSSNKLHGSDPRKRRISSGQLSPKSCTEDEPFKKRQQTDGVEKPIEAAEPAKQSNSIPWKLIQVIIPGDKNKSLKAVERPPKEPAAAVVHNALASLPLHNSSVPSSPEQNPFCAPLIHNPFSSQPILNPFSSPLHKSFLSPPVLQSAFPSPPQTPQHNNFEAADMEKLYDEAASRFRAQVKWRIESTFRNDLEGGRRILADAVKYIFPDQSSLGVLLHLYKYMDPYHYERNIHRAWEKLQEMKRVQTTAESNKDSYQKFM